MGPASREKKGETAHEENPLTPDAARLRLDRDDRDGGDRAGDGATAARRRNRRCVDGRCDHRRHAPRRTLGLGHAGAGRCRRQRRTAQPGRQRHPEHFADVGAVLQRQHPADFRRGDHRSPGEPARPAARFDPRSRQRQAPAPRGGHLLPRRRPFRRRAGAGHFGDPGDRLEAD